MTNDQHNSLRDQVLSDIETGKVTMRPKWYFALGTALLASGIIGIALLIAYVISLVIFNLRQNGAWVLPSMGFGEIIHFLSAVPWLLILVALIFILLLQVLVRKYEFAYGRPLLYSAVAVIIFAAVSGLILDRFQLQPVIFHQVRSRHVPGMDMVYRRYGEERLPRVVAGTIVGQTDTGYIIKSERDEMITVLLGTNPRNFPLNLKPGDKVTILGDCDGMIIHAAAIKKITRFPEFSPTIPHRPEPCDF